MELMQGIIRSMHDLPKMTTAELERHAALLFGLGENGKPKHGWQVRLAAAIPGKSGAPLSRESIRLWMRNDEVPEWAAALIRAMASIAPPPGTDDTCDRDQAACEAIEPELTRLRDLAVTAGWHPAEVAAAVLTLTIDEIRHGAGDEMARDLLIDALSQIEE